MKFLTKILFIVTVLALVPTACVNSSLAQPICEDLAPVILDDRIICVTYDYYSVDGVRQPLNLTDALALAESRGMRLPTVEEVDAIYEQADVRLTPIPLPPGPRMSSESYIIRHNDLIEEQLEGLNTDGLLIAGHKKDLIYISSSSSRVAIYGWHRDIGDPIQPYSTVHGRGYFDYSHGVRLVSLYEYVNGEVIRHEP
jgi:hypothetical protein